MIFLHAFQPSSIALVLGPLTIHWYGLIMAMAMAASAWLAMLLARHYGLTRETIADLALWLIIGGLIGARAYEVILEWDYYFAYPSEILQVWHGGLAIHGALLGGGLALLVFARLKNLDPWKLAAVGVPAVAVGQAIGRWGNWFNQELFGSPTGLPWGIPIDPLHRPVGYEAFTYFHPTFLYESLGLLLIAAFLCFLVRRRMAPGAVIGSYCLLYGILRFGLEFIKIDPTPVFLGLRWPQIASLILAAVGILIMVLDRRLNSAKTAS